MTSDRTGQRIDNYQLLQKLGRGSFGQVYLAEDLRRKTKVAIKILDPFTTQKERDQFFDEVRSLVRLRHPHIVSIIDFGIDKTTNLPFIVMEYAPNGSLHLRHQGQQLPLAKVVRYVKQIASALHYAHDDQLIHRDVKPDNIFIGSKGELLIGNFSIAVPSKTGGVLLQQEQKKMIGTPHYIAPEQIMYKPNCSSDQYALAVITYEWLCGKPPFNGSYSEIYQQHLHISPQSICEIVPTIPIQVEQVVLKALAKEVKDRYPSIQAFADALEAASESILDANLLVNYHGHSDAPSAFAWSPDGSCFAIGGISGLIEIWDANTGNLLRTCEDVSTNTIDALAWSPDGSRLASISNGSYFTPGSDGCLISSLIWDQTVQVWDALNGQMLLTYSGHSDDINMVAWSPDSLRIASCSNDSTVQIWDAHTGQQIYTYKGHSSPVLAVAWSPDGSRIASGSSNNTIQIWDSLSEHSHPLLVYTGHSDNVTTVAWSPDGSYIASGSSDITIQIWDTIGGQLLRYYIGHSDRVNIIAWSPDGSRMASGSDDNTVQIWDTSKKAHSLTSNHDDTFDYWGRKTRNMSLLSYANHSDRVKIVAWSPDGSRIASCSNDNTIQIWDAFSGQILFVYAGHSDDVIFMSWSPDKTRIASSVADETCSTVKVWDVLTGRHLLTYRGHSYPAYVVAWSPDGSRIASGGLDEEVHVWDTTSGEMLVNYTKPSGQISAIAWSPDSSRIASAGYNHVHVWDAISGQHLLTYTGHSDDVIVDAVMWSSDGSYIASTADETHIWDATDGWRFTDFDLSQLVNCETMSTSSSLFISECMNTEQVCSAIPSYSRSHLKAWSADGSRIAIFADRAVQVWQVRPCVRIFPTFLSHKRSYTPDWEPEESSFP